MPLLIPLRDQAPMTSSRGRHALASPITRRCLPDMTPEHAGQMLLVRKYAAMGNLRDGLLRVAKQIFRPLDPAAHHIRSEERRDGQEGDRTCRSRWATYTEKKK